MADRGNEIARLQTALAGRYSLSDPFAGGTGLVVRGRDSHAARDVAIKLLACDPGQESAGGADSVAALRRLRQEATLGASLEHPNIVKLIEVIELDEPGADPALALVFEFVPGRDLAQVLAEEGALEVGEALRFGAELLDALTYAHDRDVIHRDLKPENIAVYEYEGLRHIKLLDFGIAAIEADRARVEEVDRADDEFALGTPRHSAPEQLRGGRPDRRSDLYSWGLVLLECLTGEPAVPGRSVEEIRHRQLSASEIPLPAWLRDTTLGAILEAALAKLPEERATEASALRGLLQQVRAEDIEVASLAVPAPEATSRAHAGELPNTPLVGRSDELAALNSSCARALRGEPGSAYIRGDAGIGKSRLLAEMLTDLGDVRVLECQCDPQAIASPLLPVRIMLEREVGSRDLSDFLSDLAGRVSPRDASLEAAHPFLAMLLGRPPGNVPELSPQMFKQRTIEAIGSFVLDGARRQPTVVVVEDLQWADATTIEFIGALLEQLRARQVFGSSEPTPFHLVLTSRLDFVAPWSLAETTSIELERLSASDAQALGRSVLRGAVGVSAELIERVGEHSDGVPLFVEEVARMIAARPVESHGEAGSSPSQETEPWEIPTTLGELLAARLAEITADTLETVHLAAALGRDFEFALLSVVSNQPDAKLRAELAELLERGFLQRRPDDEYRFRHALIRDAAYQSVGVHQLLALHGRIAERICEYAPQLEQTRPDLLGYHFERAARPAEAIDWFERAAGHATQQWAHTESGQHLGRALDLLSGQPEDADRDRKELGLRSALGVNLISTTGFGTEEVNLTYERARELAWKFGDTPFPIRFGIWSVHIQRGNRETTREMAQWFEEFLLGDDVASKERMMALLCLGVRHFFRGRLEEARDCLSQGRALWSSEAHRANAIEYGGSGGFYGHVYLPAVLWSLGLLEQAEVELARTIAIARDLNDPFTLASALSFQITRGHDSEEPERTKAAADEVIELSAEHGFPYWLALALVGSGWCAVKQGEGEAGLAAIDEGLTIYRLSGSEAWLPYYLGLRVEALLELGRIDEGLVASAEALELVSRSVDSRYGSELMCLRGALHEKAGDLPQAETWLRRGQREAADAHMITSLLSANTQLARFLLERGSVEEAHGLLKTGLAAMPAESQRFKLVRDARELYPG